MSGASATDFWITETRTLKSVNVRVYYEDTDFSGFVYHASYRRFFERGRTEFLRDLDFSQRAAFESPGVEPGHFAVKRMTVDFVVPARMDDWLRIDTCIFKLGGASFKMVQRPAKRACYCRSERAPWFRALRSSRAFAQRLGCEPNRKKHGTCLTTRLL